MLRRFTAAVLALALLAAPALASQATLVTPSAPLPMTGLASFLNAALLSLGSCNSGTTAPTNGTGAAAFAGECWINTTTNPWIFNYTSDGTNWSKFGALNTSTHAWGGATFATTTSNPTGTTSTASPKMMGLGSTCFITPQFSTRVFFALSGQIANNTGTDGAIGTLKFGTGTAPVNGAADTGSGLENFALTGATANTGYPFAVFGIATGLTPGTAYWFDSNLEAITGGTATIINVGCTAYEM